jgi:hypothetical protein
VVIGDLNILRSVHRPFKADPVLIVDSDAVLSFAVALQFLKA